MSAMSSDAKQLLILEAERLGYDRPTMTKGGHLLWVHAGTRQRVITGTRLQGRALRNARAQLRRSAAIGGVNSPWPHRWGAQA